MQQQRGRSILMTLCLILLLAPASMRAAEQSVMMIADNFRPQIVKATTPVVTALNYRALFTKVGVKRLGELSKDPNNMLAVQGMWEANKRVAPKATDGRLDPAGIKAFTGFFKTRMKMDLPPWFKETLQKGRLISGTATTFPAVKSIHYVKTKAGLMAPQGTTINPDGKRFVISTGNRSVKVDRSLLEIGKDTLPERVSVLITNKRTFIALHASAGFPFRLVSVRTGSGKLNWSASVWGAGRKTLGGVGFHNISMRLKDSQLFLFGAESHGVFVETFEASSGENYFRFCSSYWFHFSETWNLK